MKQSGRLNSGKETGVGTGIGIGSGIEIGDFRGLKTYFHPGINNGYNNFVTYIPGAKMVFIIFSNLSYLNLFGKTNEVAGLFIKEPPSEKEKPVNKTLLDPIVKDTVSVQPLLGSYLMSDGNYTAFKLKDRKFYWIFDKTYSFILYRTEKDTFYIREDYLGTKFVFTVKNKHDCYSAGHLAWRVSHNEKTRSF